MQTIGVIVAGGKSRRMGRDKASIVYNGQTLLDHAATLLDEFGTSDIVILGKPDMEKGIADTLPNGGPAANLQAWINARPLPVKIVVLPVDMPLLTLEQLHMLDRNPNGGFFDDLYLPLITTINRPILEPVTRMKDLLVALSLCPEAVPCAWQRSLTNFNSKADLDRLHATKHNLTLACSDLL